MKIIVTHTSPDWDAIGSVWLIRRYLPGWHDAAVKFVPAGQRYRNQEVRIKNKEDDPIEIVGEDEVIHVDTGMGPLDHHQTSAMDVCAASRVWDYVKEVENEKLKVENVHSEKWEAQQEAIGRIVKILVQLDHFQEVFWPEPIADYQEFSLNGVLDGIKQMKPEQDDYYVEFGMECLTALVHEFENRIWAEREIKQNGIEFDTRWGKAIGFETLNDTVIKLSQKMGYVVVVRKDPRKGYVRIKARPERATINGQQLPSNSPKLDVDLTLVHEKLHKIDPEATWFLHVSKKMLLNGTPKNPKMIPSKLSLQQIIEVMKTI